MSSTEERLETAAALRDAGMATAEQAADPRVIAAIDAAIEKAIASGRRFSTNHIRDQFPVASQGLVGARIRSYAGRKVDGERLMVRVAYEASTLPNTHHHPIAVWIGAAAHRALHRHAS